MKLILFVGFIFSFNVFADGVSECEDFKTNILTKAIFEDPKAEDHPFRFVKDEKTALKFIENYQSTKLALEERVKNTKKEMSDCDHLNKPDKEKYCSVTFENLNFLRGLIYGMKHYGWKPSTIQLAKEKIRTYAVLSSQNGLPLLDLAVAYSVLGLLKEELPSTQIDSVMLKKYQSELEADIKDLSTEMKSVKTQECFVVQQRMKKEIAIAETHRTKYKTLLYNTKF